MNSSIRSHSHGPNGPSDRGAPRARHPHPDALDLETLLDMLERDTGISRADLRVCLDFMRSRREIRIQTRAAAPSGKLVTLGPEANWALSPSTGTREV
jgi:hypothetical protein